MNKDFMMGAELALRGAGIKDEQTKQQLMAKLTNAQIAKMTSELQREQEFKTAFPAIMQQATIPAKGIAEEARGPIGVQPAQLDYNKLTAGLMPYLNPSQAVTAATSLAGQEIKETPRDRLIRELMVAKAQGEGKSPNPYGTWYQDKKAQGWSEGEIIQGWLDEQLDLIQKRYPPEIQGRADLPPWITFDRIKGIYKDRAGNVLTDQDLKDAYVIQAGLKAGAGSVRNQAKVADMMGGFVRNINKQISRVEEIFGDTINRVGIRALDLPKREFVMAIKGSGHEKVLESYLAEISREIGKLSTGSSASIAELSVEAQKRWDKIHDPNLSLKELKLILDATREQANMRYESSIEQINATTQRMSGTPTGGDVPPVVPSSLTPSGNQRFKEGTKIYNIPADKVQAFKAKHPNAQEVK